MSPYENIPVSEKTLSGMTWSIDDRKYLEVMFDLQDMIHKEKEDKIFSDLAEVFKNRDANFERIFEKMFKAIEDQSESINLIHTSIKLINKKVAAIQKEQKNHGLRIHELERKFDALVLEHKGNHAKALKAG